MRGPFDGFSVFLKKPVAGVRSVLIAALAVPLLLPAPLARQTTGSPARARIGVNLHPLQDNYAVDSPGETLRRAKEIGASVVRIDIHWGWFEYGGPGTASWDPPQVQELDAFLAEAARLHVSVLATVLDTPCWASREPGRVCPPEPPHYHGSYPPDDPRMYARFLRRLVAHVGGKIQYYEIWNEPNISHFWIHPDPVAYTRLLRAAYRAIKAENPEAEVLAGATSGADFRFIERMYRAGAKKYFDALSIHPYSGSRSPNVCTVPRKSFACGVEAVRRVMLRNGDTRPLWLTEFGEPLGGDVTESMQARYVSGALSLIRRWKYVGGATWYELYDDPTGHDGQHYGLFSSTLAPRPAADAFRQKAAPSPGT